MIRRLRWKFVAAMMAVVTVILAAAVALPYLSTQRNLEQNTAAAMAEAARDSFSRKPWENNGKEPRLPFFIVDVDGEGKVIRCVQGDFSFEDDTLPQDLTRLVLSSASDQGVLENYGLSYYRIALRDTEGQRIVYADRSFETKTLEHLRRNLLLVGLGVWGLFFLLSVGLSRWITKPVERAWQQQKQFVADASHELKTPLTVILSSAQMISTRRASAPQGSLERWTENIQAEGERMKGLVEDMLTLARSDAQGPTRQLSRVCLGEVVEDGVLTFEPIAFEKGLTIGSQIQGESYVLGDGNELGRLCAILLDNGVKYCDPGGEIALKQGRRGRTACLTLSNPCAGADPAQVPRDFDRFYRADASRARSTGGCGIGLSNAKAIVVRHRGRIACRCAGGTVTFTVLLPQNLRGERGRKRETSNNQKEKEKG